MMVSKVCGLVDGMFVEMHWLDVMLVIEPVIKRCAVAMLLRCLVMDIWEVLVMARSMLVVVNVFMDSNIVVRALVLRQVLFLY